jgi:hypothetical protein
MALINLAVGAITNITIETKGGTNPNPVTVLTGPDEKVIIVEAIWVVCSSAVADSYVNARVDGASPSSAFSTAYLAYNLRLRRGSPPINILLGRSLYLAEAQTLTLSTGASSGDWTYNVSYAIVDNA